MKVQRIRLSEENQVRWLVLDNNYVPIQPILTYLQFLDDLSRSPNTIRNTACHLKLFWEFLRDEQCVWTEVDVAQLAAFITWLRRPNPAIVTIEPRTARRTNATINQILTTVHCFYDYHIRLKTVPQLPLYRLSQSPRRHYKPFLYGIAKTKPEHTRVVSVIPEQRLPKTLTDKQVQTLIDACKHTRDRFLLTLMYHTGMRIGHYVG